MVRSASVAPSSPRSRPSPPGGLRPALTPAPGGTTWPPSKHRPHTTKIKFQLRGSLYGSRGLPSATTRADVRDARRTQSAPGVARGQPGHRNRAHAHTLDRMTTSMVDWTVALNTATKLVKPGPEITRSGAAEVVAELREAAVRAEAYVTEVTGLVAPPAASPVLVVDRPRWIEANLDGFQQILAPLNAKATEKLRNASPTMAGHRPPAHRRRGRRPAQLPGAQGAGAVRPLLPWCHRGARRPAAAGRTQHRGHRTRAASSTRATSGCGSACTRRPTGSSSPPCHGCGTT